MADPMTNIEIEDVLSSIRRLVAEGTPVAPAPRRVPKLVLTPALRIDLPKESIADQATPVDVSVPPMLLDASQRVAEDDRHPIYVMPAAPATEARNSAADRASLLATIAELEAAVREQPDDWEPDGTEADSDFSWARAGFRGDVEVEDAEELSRSGDAPANASAWPETLVEAARRYGPAAQKATSSVPQIGAESIASFRHRRADNVARSEADEVEFNDDLIGGPELGEDPEDMLHSYLSGGALVDEAQLREMVRDIVRQELQGTLGERITRNVRKLVRREIHRVLTTETFD